MLASGTGYAPIRSILLDQFARQSRREFTLYWGGRTRADLYLHEEVEAWVREHPNFRYVPVLSEPTDDCQWSGRTRFVHRAVMEDFPYMSAVQVYACGAPVKIGRAHVCTPVTTAHLVCRLLLEIKNTLHHPTP